MSVIPSNTNQFPLEVFDYYFTSKTPNLAAGIPVLIPDPDSVIMEAFIAVLTAFNGTTPKADVGWASDDAAIQTLSQATGTSTAGNFTVTLNGVVSGNIAWNSASAAAQTVLQAMSNVGAGNAIVSGGPLPGTPLKVTFQGPVGEAATLMTVNSAGLTGGTMGASLSDSGFFSVLGSGAVDLTAATPVLGRSYKVATDETQRLVVADSTPVGTQKQIQLVVNETAVPGGTASGSTAGAAKLYLVVASPVRINPTDPPLA